MSYLQSLSKEELQELVNLSISNEDERQLVNEELRNILIADPNTNTNDDCNNANDDDIAVQSTKYEADLKQKVFELILSLNNTEIEKRNQQKIHSENEEERKRKEDEISKMKATVDDMAQTMHENGLHRNRMESEIKTLKTEKRKFNEKWNLLKKRYLEEKQKNKSEMQSVLRLKQFTVHAMQKIHKEKKEIEKQMQINAINAMNRDKKYVEKAEKQTQTSTEHPHINKKVVANINPNSNHILSKTKKKCKAMETANKKLQKEIQCLRNANHSEHKKYEKLKQKSNLESKALKKNIHSLEIQLKGVLRKVEYISEERAHAKIEWNKKCAYIRKLESKAIEQQQQPQKSDSNSKSNPKQTTHIEIESKNVKLKDEQINCSATNANIHRKVANQNGALLTSSDLNTLQDMLTYFGSET